MSLAEHLIGQAGELIIALDAGDRVIAAWGQDPVSRAPARQLIERSLDDIWSEGSQALLEALNRQAAEQRQSFDVSLSAAGKTLAVRVRSTVLDGAYAGARVVFIDTLQERFATSGLVQHLMHQHPDYILVVDQQGQLVDSNTAVVRDFATGVSGRIAVDDLLSESAQRQWRGQVMSALSQGADWSGHSVWLSADGRRLPMQMHVVRLAREQTAGQGHIAIFARDTSAEQRVEAALRESERTLRNILDGTPVALLGLEMSGDIVSANQRAGVLLGRDAGDLIGMNLHRFMYLRDLPADYVKIDGSFVQGMEDDPVRHQLVRSINETAQVLGKQTVAEFVDSPAALQALAELGVDMVQGWLFSPAVPIDEIPAVMARGA